MKPRHQRKKKTLMDIDINITSARAENDRLLNLASQASGIRSNVSRLRASIDPKILERSNLRARLLNAEKSIESLESDLLLLHRTTAQNINTYEEAETETISRVAALPDRLG